ncbi:MAG: enoyl-CoA hydratase-related protein [Boseongicola sp.]|nr:enoyl-CoA hydratase-related protein [Boseongicola sp.]
MHVIVIAANGPVFCVGHDLKELTAAGCQLVAACDLAVAADDAQVATPGINIGLYSSTPTVALTRNIGRKSAMRMLLSGDMMCAEKAHAMGLVRDVAASSDLTETTMALARRIAAKSPATPKTGKETFYDQVEMPLRETCELAAEVMALNVPEPDALEGIGAHFERRAPQWNPL